MSRTKQNHTKPIMAVSKSTSKIKVKLHWTFMECWLYMSPLIYKKRTFAGKRDCTIFLRLQMLCCRASRFRKPQQSSTNTSKIFTLSF